MGYVEKRGKNTWRITTHYTSAAGTREVARMTLHMDPALSEAIQRRDAERELDRLDKRLKAEQAESYTLRQWSEIWLQKHVGMDGSPVTVHNYRYLLDSRILPALGDYLLTELTPAILTDWLISVRSSPRRSTRRPDDKLARPRRESEQRALAPKAARQKPLSIRTVNHYRTTVSTMLAAAVRMGYLEYNPMDRVQRPKQRKKKKTYLTEDQAVFLIERLLQLPPERAGLKLATLLALTCGIRLGEVCALRHCDYNRRTGVLNIARALKYTPATGSFIAEPKTDAGVREIAIPPALGRIIDEARDDDLILQIDRNGDWNPRLWMIRSSRGTQVNKDTPSKWFRSFADENGFRGVTFHDLRHAHASILVAHNLDVAAIAARMGHENAAVTLSVYTHPFAAQDQKAAETLDTVLHRAGLPDPDAPAADPDAAPDAADPAGS